MPACSSMPAIFEPMGLYRRPSSSGYPPGVLCYQVFDLSQVCFPPPVLANGSSPATLFLFWRRASHSITPHAASARPGTASAPSLVPPTRSELFPRACARESNPCEKRRDFLVLPSASCSATPQKSRPNPQQTNSHASLQSTCQPRALHMTRIASRTARECLRTASAPFFLCASDPLGIRPRGRHTGMKTE